MKVSDMKMKIEVYKKGNGMVKLRREGGTA